MHGSSSLPVRFAGTGHALPENTLLSATLDATLGQPSGTLEGLSGVRSRQVVRQGEDQIGLAVAAAEAALEAAGLQAAEIDLVIGASAVPYQPIPATAPLVMARLGMAGGSAAAFDVNATCLSFLAGAEIAAERIAAGRCRAVLVVSSEIASRALPWQSQPDVAALFGDGAAAAVLLPSEGGAAIKAVRFETWPEGWEACQLGAGGTRHDYHTAPEAFAAHARFTMDGKALFKLTHRHFPAFASALLEEAGWRLDDVDLVIPHQASPLALAHMIERTGLPRQKVIDISVSHGNQIAASIPTALDMARRAGRMPAGSKVLMLGTSAGVSFGGMALVA